MREDAQWEERAALLLEGAPTAQERHHRQAVLRDIATRLEADGPHEALPGPGRARQFAPFAALKGYRELIAEVEEECAKGGR